MESTQVNSFPYIHQVAGTVDALGADVSDPELKEGDRVIVYPYEGHPPG